jgi:hypothetical protein
MKLPAVTLSKFRFGQCLLGILVLLGAPGIAAAHDIDGSTLTIWLRSTGMDVEVYFARASAELLIANPGEPIAITPNNFSDYTERLQSAGPNLLLVTAANGTIVPPDSSAVSLTDETDVRYDLHYSLAAAGPYTIQGPYLFKMPPEHGGYYKVMNARGNPLQWGVIRTDAPDFSLNIPAADALANAANPAGAAGNPVPAVAVPSVAAPPASSSPLLWVLLIGCASLMIILAFRGVAQSHSSRKTPP